MADSLNTTAAPEISRRKHLTPAQAFEVVDKMEHPLDHAMHLLGGLMHMARSPKPWKGPTSTQSRN